MVSPNISSAFCSPSSETLIWRVCTSSSELRVTVIWAEAACESEGLFCGMARLDQVRNDRRRHAGEENHGRRERRLERQERRNVARSARGARDRNSGGAG